MSEEARDDAMMIRDVAKIAAERYAMAVMNATLMMPRQRRASLMMMPRARMMRAR